MRLFESVRFRYLAGMVLLIGLLVLNQGVVQYWLWKKDKEAHIINQAGRQRMLSQRIALMATQMPRQPGYSDSLRRQIQHWTAMQNALLQGNAMLNIEPVKDARARLLLGQAELNIQRAQQWYFQQLLPDGDRPDVDVLIQNQEQFLQLMDAAVNQLESQADAQLRWIIWLELLLAATSIAVLFIEMIWLYKPILNTLRKALVSADAHFAKLNSILSSTSDAHVLVDREGKLLSFNQKALEVGLRISGKTMQEGDNIYSFLIENRKRQFALDLQVVLQGKELRKEEQLLVGNQLVWFQITMYPAYNQQRQIIGAAYNATNIQEKKQAELAQADAEEKFRSIVNYAPMMVFILNKQQQITLSNAMAAEVLGYDTGRLEECKVTDVFSNWQVITANTDTYGREDFSATARRADGSFIEVEGSAKHFLLNQEPQCILMLRDVSLQKANERSMQRQQAILRDISWLQNHEMRKPVANILSLVHLLKDDADVNFHPRYVSCIETEALNMDAIIHKIVNEAMPEAPPRPV